MPHLKKPGSTNCFLYIKAVPSALFACRVEIGFDVLAVQDCGKMCTKLEMVPAFTLKRVPFNNVIVIIIPSAPLDREHNKTCTSSRSYTLQQ